MYAYGQVPEEYYEESQLYPNQSANDELALSIDDTIYVKGDTVNVFGVVKDYNSGVPILIQVYDPDEKQILDLKTLAGSSGNFKVPFKIPQDAIVGKYTVSGKYGTAGKIASIEFIIKGSLENIVTIPRGSSTGDAKFNFTPKNITINYGAEITWTNNDNSLHTVVSGKVGLDNRMYADGLFDSGTFGPASTFTRSFFNNGTYPYFCKLHPWLTGQIIVTPYVGPPDQKPVPQEPSETGEENNNYLIITTKRQIVKDHEKTLFDDNMTSVFWTWTQPNTSSTIIESDVANAKIGKNSLKIQVETQNGQASTFQDYSKEKLQDWSHYNYLNFWFKGQNTNKTITTFLRNETWKAPDRYDIVDDSSDWKKVQIPLYATYKNMDMSKIRGLEFWFKLTSGEFFVDDVVLSAKTNAPNLEIDSGSYIFGDTIQVSGIVPDQEPDSPVTIKVINPTQNIVTINQISVNLDNTFNFTLPILGQPFNKEGTYKISAQYGFAQYQNSTSFKLIVPQLVETYKGFDVYHVSNTFYSILQREGGFDINRIRADQYSIILSGNSLDEIKKTIDETKIIVKPTPSEAPLSEPSPALPVSDDVLLAIWKDRKDLQKAFPEVEQGVLDHLKKWAIKAGWKEDSRLSALIPSGEMPNYLKSNTTSSETAKSSKPYEDGMQTLLVGVIIAIAISAIIGYRFLRGKKQY